MLHQQRELRIFLAQMTDAVLLGFGLWLAHFLRFNLPDWSFDRLARIQNFESFHPILAFVVLFGPIILDACHIYRHTLIESQKQFTIHLLQSMLLLLGMTVLLIYLLRMGDLARGVILLFTCIAFALIATRHFLLQDFFDRFLHGRYYPPSVLLVGDAESTERLQRQIATEKSMKMTVVGAINNLDNLQDEISNWLHRHPISAVIFRAPHLDFEKVQQGINLCEREGVEAWMLADHIQPNIFQLFLERFQDQPVLVFSARKAALWEILSKRLLDLLLSGIGLILAAPLMLLVALIIRITSRGPAIFTQERSGLHGRVFRMHKFRSMISNAAMLQSELTIFNEMKGPVFKITKDPRVTRFGAFLRRSSMDELPQLWNVFKGEMSMVGPRPLPIYETQQISTLDHRRRLSMKPGLTCLWQISGRNVVCDFNEWARLDLQYVDNWSFWLDLKILLKTVPVVLFGFGAR